MSLIAKLLGLLIAFLPKGDTATKVAGNASSLATVGAAGGAVLWLLGPGREWTITLNALELSAIALGGAALLEWARQAPPPSP